MIDMPCGIAGLTIARDDPTASLSVYAVFIYPNGFVKVYAKTLTAAEESAIALALGGKASDGEIALHAATLDYGAALGQHHKEQPLRLLARLPDRDFRAIFTRPVPAPSENPSLE